MLTGIVQRRLRTVVDVGVAKGMRGNRAWLAVGAVGYGWRVLSRLRRRDEVIWRAELAPGERLEIGHLLDSFRDLGEKPPR